jgi:hypothetical protein
LLHGLSGAVLFARSVCLRAFVEAVGQLSKKIQRFLRLGFWFLLSVLVLLLLWSASEEEIASRTLSVAGVGVSRRTVVSGLLFAAFTFCWLRRISKEN